MITYENGKYRSTREVSESKKILDSSMNTLSADEKEALKIILDQLGRDSGASKLYNQLSDLEFKTKPVDLKTFIFDEYYLGKTCDVLYPKWTEALSAIFDGGYEEVVFCLHPDTPIPLLDGTTSTISDLASKWEKVPKPFWVYGVTPDGRVTPALAENPHQTGVDDYYKVTLDDGTSFTCNARHQMIMRTGEKRMICDLAPGASLMPFKTSLSVKGKGRRIKDYELVLDLLTEKEVYTHARVCEDTQRQSKNGEIIHHKDFRKANNSPDNLELMHNVAHIKLHKYAMRKYLKANPKAREALAKRQRIAATDSNSPLRKAHLAFMNSEDGRKLSAANLATCVISAEERRRRGHKASEIVWKGPNSSSHKKSYAERMRTRNLEGNAAVAGSLSWVNSSEESKKRRSSLLIARNKLGRKRRTDVTIERMLEAVESGSSTIGALANAMKCSTTRILRAASDSGVDIRNIVKHKRNHYIVSIEKLGRGPVFCMTVPKTSNFAIATRCSDGSYTRNGVFSSNTGSLGAGKTFAASIGICYLIYLLSVMKNPQKTFGLGSASYIDIVVFSVTEDLAVKVAFENIVSKIEASEYFQVNYPFKVNKKQLEFPNKVRVSPRATTDNSAVGLNVMSVLMDETDFMKSKGNKKVKTDTVETGMADNIYGVIKRRMKSRFAKQGRLPGILFVVSSKSSRDSFSERLIRSNMTNPLFFVRDFSTWEVKPEDTFSSKDRFWVLVGNEAVPSRILTPQEYEVFNKSKPDGCILIDVPEDYRSDFTSNLEGSIRDVAGIATISVSPFIQRVETLISCIDAQKRAYPNYGHPFTTESYEPGTGSRFIWSLMVQEVQERGPNRYAETVWRPKINANAARSIHIDPSISGDATGIAMAHVCGWMDVQRRASDGQIYSEKAPIYFVDFILKVVPPIGNEIVLADTRQMIYDLSAHGYTITSVTYDSYQSADSTQILKSKGYNSDVLSVDRTIDPYETLKTALYENRVLMYHYNPLLEELRTIKKDIVKRKIDHDPGKSKDQSDALAGCIFNLSKQVYAMPLPMIRDTAYEATNWSESNSSIIPGTSRESTEMWQDILPPFILD